MTNKPLKILLVDDDHDDAFLIKDLLREGLANYPPEIDHSSSFENAISYLKQNTYDLCMFDYRLGEVNGINLLRTIKGKNIVTPVILLTGQGDQEIAVEAMKAGATDYLVKAKLSSQTLTNSIRYTIKLHEEAQRRKQAEEMLHKSHEELKKAHKELQDSMTKLQSAQNQILQSEKLAGIGRLAAGVCHEILNPLNIISGHTQALLMERDEDPTLIEDLGSITEEIHRIEKIISGLLKFSRKGDVELKYSNINDELNSVLSIVEKEMSLEGIDVVRNFKSDLPILLMDTDRMRQVFLNMINNAKYAMKGGGTLTVSTETLAETKSVVIPANGTEGSTESKFLRIKFADTGTGISKDNMAKIFDPFFTTKPEEKGTGLGLSVCFSIVEKHGGALNVESDGRTGATFTIDLPLSKAKRNDLASINETS